MNALGLGIVNVNLNDEEEIATDSALPSSGLIDAPPSRPVSTIYLPNRVHSGVRIQIKDSGLYSNIKGVFTRESVSAGALILKIERPFVNIGYDSITKGPKSLQTVCDNCCAVSNSYVETTANLDPEYAVQFHACPRCKVLFYCSRECRDTAWDNHHKNECELFWKLNREAAHVNRLDIIFNHKFRFVSRLLQLRANHQISDEGWAEIKALKPSSREIDMKNASTAATFTKFLCESKLPEDEIEDLLCLIQSNLINIYLPILKGHCENDPALGSVWRAGITFDPFLSLINHSSEPNAYCVMEGGEIRVRALDPLTAGDEISFCRVINPNCVLSSTLGRYQVGPTYKSLDENCTCEFCVSFTLDPTGALRARTLKLMKLDSLSDPPELAEIHELIVDLGEHDWPLDLFPMRELHQSLMRAYVHRLDAAASLKIVLQLYYYIEPEYVPKVSAEERLSTLHCLFSVLRMDYEGVLKIKGLPVAYIQGKERIILHLHVKIITETINVFGADSHAARFQQKELRAWGDEYKVNWKNLSDEDRMEDGVAFKSGMNALLVWAELEELDMKDFFP